MADDWNVGDLALCIKQGAWQKADSSGKDRGPFTPLCGSIYVVAGVWCAGGPKTLYWPKGSVGLSFAEAPMKCFGVREFRKVTPPEADDFDRETVALYQRDIIPTEITFDREPHSDRAGGAIAPFGPAGPAVFAPFHSTTDSAEAHPNNG